MKYAGWPWIFPSKAYYLSVQKLLNSDIILVESCKGGAIKWQS